MNKGKCTKGEFLSKLKEIVAELEEPDNSGQMMPSVCPHRQVGEQGHIKMHPTVCLDGQNAVPYPTINYDGQDAIPQKVKVLPHVFHGQATDKRQSLSIMISECKPVPTAVQEKDCGEPQLWSHVEAYQTPSSPVISIERRSVKNVAKIAPYEHVIAKLKTDSNTEEGTEFDFWAKSLSVQLNTMELSRALQLQLKIQTLISEERLCYEQCKWDTGFHTATGTNLGQMEHPPPLCKPNYGSEMMYLSNHTMTQHEPCSDQLSDGQNVNVV